MSSNGTHDAQDQGHTIFHSPILCEVQERIGQYGPFQNFRFTRPYLDPQTGERQKSNWHTLNQTTLDQLRRLVDELQERLDAETAQQAQASKTNGTAKRKTTRKKAASRQAAP